MSIIIDKTCRNGNFFDRLQSNEFLVTIVDDVDKLTSDDYKYLYSDFGDPNKIGFIDVKDEPEPIPVVKKPRKPRQKKVKSE